MTTKNRVTLTAKDAASRFLVRLDSAIEKPHAAWAKRLKAYLEDSDLPRDEVYAFFEITDTRALFLTAVAAMEASRIRTVFSVEVADSLLAETGDQLDALFGCEPGGMSGLFWDILARVQISTIDDTKKAHDLAMAHLFAVLKLKDRPPVKDMLRDFVVRQNLSEPLAVCSHYWWKHLAEQADVTISDPSEVLPAGNVHVAPASADAIVFKI